MLMRPAVSLCCGEAAVCGDLCIPVPDAAWRLKLPCSLWRLLSDAAKSVKEH